MTLSPSHNHVPPGISELDSDSDIVDSKLFGLYIWPFLRCWWLFNQLEDNCNDPLIGYKSSRKFIGDAPKLKNALKGIQKTGSIEFFCSCLHKINQYWLDKDFVEIHQIVSALPKVYHFSPIALSGLPLDNHNATSPKIAIFLHRALFPFAKAISTVLLKTKTKTKLNSLRIDWPELLGVYFSGYFAYRVYFILSKPKSVVVNRYYWQAHIFAAARQHNVPVLEVQQGFLCPHYSLPATHEQRYRKQMASHFLAYDEHSKEAVIKGYYSTTERTILYSVPSFYDDLQHDSASSELLSEIYNINPGAKAIVCIAATQYRPEKVTLFLKKAAEKLKDIVFIVAPKRGEHYLTQDDLPENIRILNTKYNLYHALYVSHFHSTTSSTSALEAPLYGCINLLINIDNIAWERYKRPLPPSETNCYANNVDEYVDAAKSRLDHLNDRSSKVRSQAKCNATNSLRILNAIEGNS